MKIVHRAALAASVLELAACSTSNTPTLAQQIAYAQVGVDAACEAAGVLVGTGEIHGQDADNVNAGCVAARDILAALLVSLPPSAVAAPAPAASSSAP